MEPRVVRRSPFGTNPLVGERGTDTQQRILSAALEVFGEVGFADARVELITEKAGCSRPAFYQYYATKDDVFWALAAALAREMVELSKQLGRVTPDAGGLTHLTEWIGRFMTMHEAWSPVFDWFQAASRGHKPEASRSRGVADRTAVALLKAFGGSDRTRSESLVNNLVSVLIRCSFYAERAPAAMSAQPLVEGVAALFHRVLEGPIEGVNVPRHRGRRAGRNPIAAQSPKRPRRALRPEGEKTRRRLLDAGNAVLPSRGYHDARVDDIVALAGVSHGTFYRYFDNKDDFFHVLAEEASEHLIALIDRLDLDASAGELRAWLRDWLAAYQADGGVISVWQEMQMSEHLADFSQGIAATVFTRLVRMLQRRDFGNPLVDATMLLALLERVPYNVYTLGFTTERDAVENMLIAIRRGFLARPD